MAGSDWVWSIAAAEANLRRHGVSFQLAVRVFNDPLSLSRCELSSGEAVWQTIGQPDSATPSVLLVVQSLGLSPDDRGRIVGARLATPTERNAYEEGRHGTALED